MSLGVRVSVGILVLLVVISAGVAVLTLMQKQQLQGQNTSLNGKLVTLKTQLDDLTTKNSKMEADAADLNKKIVEAQAEKGQLQTQYEKAKQDAEEVQTKLDAANTERDDLKGRVDTISKERDGLLEKVRNQPVKIVYKTRTIRVPAAGSTPGTAAMPAMPTGPMPSVSSKQGEQYWAAILKQKAALQIQVEKEKTDLDQAALQVVELKKQKADLEVEIKQVKNERDEIVQKIKYGQDLADNLSIDLARSRNDQQAVNERAEKLKEENLQLLDQIRVMNATKLDLEKNVSRLTDAKDTMQKKLVQTESVIQSRIDDIWKIKSSLDKKLAENAPTSTESSMELPPIIVNAPNNQQQQQQQQQPQSQMTATMSGRTEGTVISINVPNNFVILDLGQQNSSISVGTPMKVYRNGSIIASLEVIQVRRDISAADIKEKSTELRVGDIARF
jgi:chromosome segregation ATPase